MGCGASAKPAPPRPASPPPPGAASLPRAATHPSPRLALPGTLKVIDAFKGAKDGDATPSSEPPALPKSPRKDGKLRACKYGSACYQRNATHLSKFAHPGDRNYRIGQVSFGKDQKPDLQTLWQLYSFHDPDESGYLVKADFEPLYAYVADLMSLEMDGLDATWDKINQNYHLNFSGMVGWSEELGMTLPIGLDDANEVRPCRFKSARRTEPGDAGEAGDETLRCSCPNFEAAEDGFLCICGHKPSMHRSDHAEASATSAQVTPEWWAEDKTGLVEVEDEELISKLQEFLDTTHKDTDNWTRDRGCKLHGRHHPDCNFHCAFKNQVPVPSKYAIKKVLRNQNLGLWTKYSMMRKSIGDECARESDCKYEDAEVVSKGELDTPLMEGCNEWRLLHGTNIHACVGICNTNFRLALAGTGATWKDPGKEKGSPLYGYGIYLAERVTKSDEYSSQIDLKDLEGKFGEELDASLAAAMSESELCCMLVVRCVGGKTNVVTTNDIDKEKLKSDVFDGPHHSVFGDRVVSLGKPYREIVVYDKDQCYPEFILLYERGYD